MLNEIIINLAPTGIRTTKEMNIHVPMSEEEIINDVYECYKLGIQIVHLHVKDKNGNNTSDKNIYKNVILGIRKKCPDLIICVSLSGRVNGSFESRSDVLDLYGDAKPDMGSLTLSSLNFTDTSSSNSPEMIIKLLNKMNEKNIKPELEVFDMGMINYSKYLIKKGLLTPPYYYNIICGNLFSSQATLLEIGCLINALPENSIFTLGGIGNCQFNMNIYGILNANGIRTGLEDNIYYDTKKEILGTNKMYVERILETLKITEKTLIDRKKLKYILNIE